MERGIQKIRSYPYKGDKKTGVYRRSSAPSRLCVTEDYKQNAKCKMHVSRSKEKAAVELPKENINILRRFLRAIKDFDGVMKKLKEAISYTKECISDESSKVLDCIGDLSSIVSMLERKIQDVLRRSISEEMSIDILMEHTKASERIKEEINLCQKDVGLCLEMTQKVQNDDAEFQELIECKEILQMDEMIACYENLKNMVISLQQALERDRNELKYTADNQQEFRLMIQAKIRENETLRQSNVKYSRDVKAKEQKIKDMLHKLSSLKHSATNKDIRVNVATQTTSGLKMAIAEKNIQIIKLQKELTKYKCSAEKEQVKSIRLTKEKNELENKLHDTQNTLFSSTSAPLNNFKMTSLSNEVITLKKSVKEKNKTFQAMMNAKAELELQLSTLQKEVDQKNEMITNLENVIKDNRCNYEEVSSLKDTLEQLRKTAAEKDQIIKSLECDFDKLRKEKENKKRIQDISNEKIAELEEERNALQTIVKELEKTILNSTMEKETKCTEAQQLIEKVSRFEHEVAVIAKERDFLRNENSLLLQEIEKSIVERNKLRRQFSEIETAQEEKICTEQEQTIQELNGKVAKQRQNQQDLKLEGNRFQKDKGDTERNQREKIRALEKERNDLMDEKLNIGKLLAENNKTISDLHEALVVSRSNILKFEQMIKNLRMEVAASSREIQSLQENIISMKESLAIKQQQRKAFEESASKIKEEYQMIQKIIEGMKVENERIKEENETIKEETELIKEKNETIKEETELIKEENEGIKEDNGRIKEDNERIKEENEKLKEENDTIKDEIKAKKQVLQSYSDRKQKQQRESETKTADIMEFLINASSEKPESFYKSVPNLDNHSEDYLDKCHDLEMALSQKKKELRKMSVENFLLKEFTYTCVTDAQERMATLWCLVSNEEEMIMEMEKGAQEQTIGFSKEDFASNFTKQKDDIQAPVCVLEDKIRTLQVKLLKTADETENLSTEMFKLQERINPIVCDNERCMNLTVERKVIMDNIRSLEDVIKKCEDSMGAGDIVQERNQLIETISMLQQKLRTENENIKMIMNQRNAFLEDLQTAMSEVEKKKEVILSIEREKEELSVNLSVYEDQLLKTDEAWKKTSEEKEKCMRMLNFSKGILENIAQLVDKGKFVLQGDLAVV